MVYLAVLFAHDYEWMAISDTAAQAKQKVFDGFNVFVVRQVEMREGKGTITHEYATKRLKEYYSKNFRGDVSIDTLQKGYQLEVLEVDENECYRDGYRVPSRIQDF